MITMFLIELEFILPGGIHSNKVEGPGGKPVHF